MHLAQVISSIAASFYKEDKCVTRSDIFQQIVYDIIKTLYLDGYSLMSSLTRDNLTIHHTLWRKDLNKKMFFFDQTLS